MAYKLGFVMEQTLGHVTHTENFRHWAAKDPEITPTWILVSFDTPDPWDFIRRNWTVRASLQARAQVQAVLRTERLDGLFFHTQVTALFAERLMAKIPTVISMDATPLNFDSIGRPYDHSPSGYRLLEAFKNALNRRTFSKARRLITWHEWGKDSLVRDYSMNPGKVEVIPPGIDLGRWNFPRSPSTRPQGPVRLLFVGGDFRRKGGEILLKAFRQELMRDCELDIVTRDDVDTRGLVNVRVHRGLGPNAEDLLALYARADLFVFPTFGDTLPIVLMEAMASGLPVVATRIGALHEEVEDGVTGFLVQPGDADALAQATRRLVADPDLLRQMSDAARRRADRLFNGAKNYSRLLTVCKRCVDEG